MSWPGFGRQTIDDSLTCRHLQSLSQCVWQWTATSSTASMARNSYILRSYLIHLSHAKELPVFLRSWITHQGLSPLALFVEKITSTHFTFFSFLNSLFFSLFTSSFPRIKQILLSDSIKEWRQKKSRGTGGEYEFFTSFFFSDSFCQCHDTTFTVVENAEATHRPNDQRSLDAMGNRAVSLSIRPLSILFYIIKTKMPFLNVMERMKS